MKLFQDLKISKNASILLDQVGYKQAPCNCRHTPEPRPGPTGILFCFAQFIKSKTIENDFAKPLFQ